MMPSGFRLAGGMGKREGNGGRRAGREEMADGMLKSRWVDWFGERMEGVGGRTTIIVMFSIGSY